MGRYAYNPQAIRDLVRETEVHRDVYIDPEIFDLEMKHLFANTWVHVGHASQVPNPGDYLTTTIGSQPVIMVRHTDGTVKVLYNRCPHKGTKIAIDGCGNAGKFFRCPTMPGPSRPTAASSRSPCARATRTRASKTATPPRA